MVRNWGEHYVHLLRSKRGTWNAYIANLPDCEDKDVLIDWVKGKADENGKFTRGMWSLKGRWEEMAEQKAESAQRDKAMRDHEKLVTETKRKKR